MYSPISGILNTHTSLKIVGSPYQRIHSRYLGSSGSGLRFGVSTIPEQEFNAHPYTVIVGANNGGKSTVID